MSVRRRIDRLFTALTALGAVGLMVFVLWPHDDPLAGPRMALTAAGGDVWIENSKEGEAILGKRRWKPGQRARGKVAIANAGREAGAFHLSVKRARDRRGPFRGRLSRATRIRVVRMRPVVDGRHVVYDGRLRKLGRIRVGAWPAGSTRHFRLRATLTPAGDNPADRYQGARLSLSFVWTSRAESA